MPEGYYHPRRPDGQPTNLDCIKDLRTRRWYESLYQRCPPWVTRDMILPVYRRMMRLRAAGAAVVVDHIIPLRHPLVCGLHVPANLRIISEGLNAQKGNGWWPDMPWAQQHLFGCPETVEQYELSLQVHSTSSRVLEAYRAEEET